MPTCRARVDFSASSAAVASTGAAEVLEEQEARAGVDEGHRRLLRAEAEHLRALGAQVHDQRREVAVRRDDAEGVGAVAVEQVQRVDHQAHVGGVLALGVVELLDRADGVLVQHVLPALQPVLLPVAVGAPHVDHAELGQLGEDHVDLAGRRVVGIDEQRDARLFLDHGASDLSVQTCCQASVSPPRSGLSSASPKGTVSGSVQGCARSVTRAGVARQAVEGRAVEAGEGLRAGRARRQRRRPRRTARARDSAV